LRGFLALLIVGLFGLVPAVDAAESVPTLSGYTVTSWSGSDGLTLGPVRALAQDNSGYLWAGTDSGLYRFDGFHFATAEAVGGTALPKVGVRALLVAHDGDLWIGLGNGGGVYRMHADQIRAVPGLRIAGSVNALIEDERGVIWAGHDNGLMKLEQGHATSVGAAEGLSSPRVLHLRMNGSHLVAGTMNGLFERRPDGRFSRVVGSGDGPVRGSAQDVSGRIWLTDPVRGFRAVRDVSERSRAIAGRSAFLLADKHGKIWVPTIGQGLWRFTPGPHPIIERLTLQNGLLSDGIWTLLEDREGNLWVGTHEGLNRLTPYIATPLVELGITSTIVRGSGNVMWAASSEGVIRLPSDGELSSRRKTIFPLSGVRTLHADASGTVWIASNEGISRLADGVMTRVALPHGLPMTRITAITSDRHLVIWFADTAQGIWRRSGSRMEPYALPEHLRGRRVTLLHGDRNGTVWMAFEGGALAAADEGSFVEYGPAEGLPHQSITGAYDDDTGLWVSGNHGLSHLVDGRFVTLGREQGLPVKRALGVTGAGDGTLWLALGTIGIARLRIDEFTRAVSTPGYQAHVRVFDTSDGTAGVPTMLDSHTAALAPDGRVWFVTGRGLTVIEPDLVRDQPAPSGPVRVEAAVADDHRVVLAAGAGLPAGTGRVRIDYTALNLTNSERARFRYRLDGFDDDWRDAGTRRQAFYTNLPPRAYTFRVETDDGEGGWRSVPAEWSFSIAPRFSETPAFYAMCGVGMLLLVAVAWQLRLRKVRKDFALVLAERGRLGRDIHDGLLQNMVGIALKIDSIAHQPAQSNPDLVSVRREIEDCIAEARQSIWNLRSGEPDGAQAPDLIVALEAAGGRATAGTAVRFRLNVSGTPRRCSHVIETELLHIAQEALSNAVRHGHPTNVVMDLAYDGDEVGLRVHDDGLGFAQSARTAAAHFGLITMRERAEQLGGRFRLTSAAGAGTEVETIIPLSSNA
jgi:signal transduction histidine kinase/ligand-binding sensor domain-containing protein